MFGKYYIRFLVIGFVLWVLSDGIRVAPGFQGNFLPGPDTDETLTDIDHSQHNGEESPQTEGHPHEDTGEPGLQRQQKNSEFKEQTTLVVNTSREDIDSVRWLPDLKNDTLPLHDGDLVDEAGNHGNQNQQENQHQQQQQENQQHQQQQQQQENQEHQQQQQENQEHQQQQENREHQQQQENQEHQQQQENHQHQQQQMTTEQSPTAETHTEEEKSGHNENTESVLNPGEVTDSQPVNVPIIDSGHESIANSPDRSTSPTERPDIDSGQHNIQGFGTEKYGGEVDQTETYVNLPEVTNGLPVDSGPHEILPEGFGTEANHGEKVKQQTLDPAMIRNTEEVTYSPTEPNYIEPHTGSEQQGVITTPKPEPVYTEPHHELIPTEWIKVNPKAITDTNPLAGPTEEVPGEPNMGTSAPDVNNSATENVFTEQNLHITSIPMNITDAEHQNNGGEETDNNNNDNNKHGDKNSGTGSSKSANIIRITPTTPKKGFFPNESNSSFVETTPSDSELMPSSSISLHPSTPGIPENTPGIPENTPGMNSNEDTTKPSIHSIILRSSETVGIPSTTRLFAKSSVTMATSQIENTASSHHGTTIHEELLPSSSLPVVTSTPIVTSDISGSATKSLPTLQRSVSVNIHSSRASHSSTVMVQASPSVAYLPLTSDGLIINGDKKKTKTTRQPSSPPTSATRRRSSPATVTTQQQSGPQTSPTQQQSGPQTSPTQQQSGPLTSPTRQHSGPGTIPTRQHSGPGTISTRQHSGPGTVPTRQHSGPRTVPTRQHSGPGTIPTRQQSGTPTSHTRQHSVPGTIPTRQNSGPRTIPTRQHFGPSSGPLTPSTRQHSGPTRQHSSSVTVPTGQHWGSATIPTGQHSSIHRNRTTVSVQSNATRTHSDNRTRSTSFSVVTHSTVSVKTKNTKPDTNSGMKNPAKTTSAKPGEKHPENESTVNTPAPSTYQPTVFIQISLRMTLPEFCSQKHIFTTELVKVIDTQGKVLEEKQVVYLNMHPLRCEEISKPSEEHEKITEVKVDIYIKDSKGNADVELTESCATMIKPGFHKLESSQFKHQITKVELVPHPQYVESGHTAIPTKSKEMEPGITIAVVIASVGGVCCVTLLILQIIIHRRSGKRMKPYFPGTNRYSIRSLDSIALGVVPKSRPNSGFWNPGLEQEELPTSTEPSHPLGYNALSNFIRDSNEVDAEFETLPHPMPRLSCVPVGAEDKNRFANVIPYPHTRVKLKEIPDEENSTYINANYVTGYRCDHKAYIATQDPMKNTVNDFWRMIWEQQARVILMLTPMDELGQPRCSPYWPENDTANGRKNYGDYTVTLKKKDVTPEYTVSVLELKDIENNLLREIRHFWYTCWPIDGTPEPISFVKFVLDTRPHYEDSGAAVVVHCSPGTGRTGSFIALDICMRSYECKRTVNVANVVHRVRQERAGAVQTKDQYQLIYKALNEYATVMSSPSVSANSSVVTLHNML